MVRKEFQVHKLNEGGMTMAKQLGEVFSEALDKIESIAGAYGREMSIVRTKLEEAIYFAKRAMAQKPGNQLPAEQ